MIYKILTDSAAYGLSYQALRSLKIVKQKKDLMMNVQMFALSDLIYEGVLGQYLTDKKVFGEYNQVQYLGAKLSKTASQAILMSIMKYAMTESSTKTLTNYTLENLMVVGLSESLMTFIEPYIAKMGVAEIGSSGPFSSDEPIVADNIGVQEKRYLNI